MKENAAKAFSALTVVLFPFDSEFVRSINIANNINI